MPNYDYLCDDCGPFTDFRPMSDSDLPCECPGCGESSPRAFFNTPYMSGLSTERRHAFATNERSAHEPKSTRNTGHGPGCGCCGSGQKARMTYKYKDGSKSFPKSRPWMISH